MSRRRTRNIRRQLPRRNVISPSRSLTGLRLSPPNRVGLRVVEDRRTFHPLGRSRPVRVFSGHPVQPLVPAAPRRRPGAALPARIGFPHPGRTVLCVRRAVRREVLFAKGGAGGRASRARKRRNQWSDVKC